MTEGKDRLKTPVLRQNRKVQCKSKALLGSRKVSGAEENLLYRGGPAGIRPRPADALGGSRFWGKESSSTDPKSGEQWTPFGKINLVPGGKRTQGARKPSAMLLADICLSVCLSTPLCVCVCASIVPGLILFWCIVLFSLF